MWGAENKYVACIIESECALLGTYLLELSMAEIHAIEKYVFKLYPTVRKISTYHALINEEKVKKHNDFHINLPNTEEELDRRISKKGRYNIKRELRLINEHIGNAEFVEYDLENVDCSDSLMKTYFSMKEKTHHRNYGMSTEEYLEKYYVTHIYTLETKEKVLAMVLSCEQGDIVYIENLTYDIQYADYSPGQVLYDWYLKRLIQKGKMGVFLSGGKLEYKKRYDGIECQVSDIAVYRNNVLEHIRG